MKKLLIIPFLLIVFLASGQSDSLFLLHYYQPGKGLMMKWVPVSYEVFQQGFKTGYNLYRAEVISVNGGERTGEYIKLNATPISCWKKDKLEAEIRKDPDLEIAAMYISGTEEMLQRPPASTPAEAITDANAKELFHLIGSFSAISRNKVAEALGVYFVDQTAVPDKKYLYKLEVAEQHSIRGYLLVMPSKNAPKEKILGVNARLTPGAVYLDWFNNGNRNYPYFNVYRSEKKTGPYTKLNKIPLAGTSGNAEFSENTSMYIDSIQQYNKSFYYKIVGVNAFEVEGIPSDPVEIKTFYLLKTSPVISGSSNPQEQDIELSWAIDPEDKPYVKGYSVFRAGKPDGPFYRVHKELLKPDRQSFMDKTEKGSSNYYIVSAYGAGGDSVNSLMHMRLLVDSIPPSKPEIVYGVCDTNGIVTIRWKRNKEKDMLGYRVFKNDRTIGEPLRVIPGHTTDTMLVDTVNLKSPYNKVYYRIAALDQHFNPSVPSDYFAVALPDLNPPTNGYFKEYQVGMNGIHITWEPSSAYDLKCMILLRKSDEEFEYKTIRVFSGNSLYIAAYTDTNTRAFVNYQYVLVAEDQAGLRSEKSKPITAQQLDKRKIMAVSDLKAIASKENKLIKLSWQYQGNARGFKLYRSRNNGPLETYEFISGEKREFYDKWLKPKSRYTYLMVAETNDGYQSGYSNKIEVTY